jgi:hypothetical protein
MEFPPHTRSRPKGALLAATDEAGARQDQIESLSRQTMMRLDGIAL